VWDASEIDPQVSRENAVKCVRRLRAGKDVYTEGKFDAYKLANSVLNGKIAPEGPHDPPQPSPTGREHVYY
jgi:hypothetical protein